ncbi:diacylglycerol/lipid kinase family protein [Cytophaga aurantiaca]|uniref:diacylglycerol/lipid kinase family protein n=1 Tax=Cytophaga aurantiaca TaxID=29530 RepID=UPI00036AB06C|nr:diacylglycerol kinase family protein [Cytophaga aurantiaca]
MTDSNPEILFLFIINPVSGTTRKHNISEMIYNTLKTDRNRIKIVLTRYAGHGREIAAEAAQEGIPYVISVGGDGTMNEIASSLLHTKTSLGIIPMGSGNGLARHLGIPLEPLKAIELMNNFTVQTIDNGNINGIPFFCTAGIGLDAHVAKVFDELPTRGLKTYVKAFIKKVRSYRGDQLHIRINEDKEINGTFLLCTFANANQYGNNAFIAPNASLSDKQLNMVLMKPVNVLEAIEKVYKLFSGKLDRDRDIHHDFFETITIERNTEGPAHIDGEPIMLGTSIHVRCVPQSLKILVPKKKN